MSDEDKMYAYYQAKMDEAFFADEDTHTQVGTVRTPGQR